MIRSRPVLTLGVGFAILAIMQAIPTRAADEEVPKEIIAVQLRKQGFECKKPESATRSVDAATDEPTWILKCEGVSYKVVLVPNQAAKVEKLPDEPEESNEPAATPADSASP